MPSPYFLGRDDFPFQGKVYREFHSTWPELDYAKTLAHVQRFVAIEVVKHATEADRWWLCFRCEGHEFVVESHFHGTATTFAVLDPDCDDRILLTCLGLFAPLLRPSEHSLDAPFHMDQTTTFSHVRRWLMRAAALASGGYGYWLSFSEPTNAIALFALAVFLLVVSFASDT